MHVRSLNMFGVRNGVKKCSFLKCHVVDVRPVSVITSDQQEIRLCPLTIILGIFLLYIYNNV